jgi:hypothetical protein
VGRSFRATDRASDPEAEGSGTPICGTRRCDLAATISWGERDGRPSRNRFGFASSTFRPAARIDRMQTSRAPGPERTFTFIHVAGEHVLRIVGNDGRWCVSVDGCRLDGWFVTKTDAWAAGLAQAGCQ